MPDSGANEFGSIWRHQPEERLAVDVDQLVRLRSRELYSRTRYEILMSIAAGLVFISVIAWRFASDSTPLPQIGLAVAAIWVVISAYWFRDRIRRRVPPNGGALAATGIEYYRKELERRRDHLKNEWLWHGPLFVACLTLAAVLIGRAFRSTDRLLTVLPLIIVLAAWTVFSIRRRRLEAEELQREIDQLG